jgi:hypothetical protein
MPRTHLLLIAAAGLGACTSVSFVPLGAPTAYPRVDVEHVRSYLTEIDVGAPYEKVALLFAESATELGSEVKVIRAMREKAAELGADGIIVLALAEGFPNGLFDLGEEHRGRAIAIKIVGGGSTPE